MIKVGITGQCGFIGTHLYNHLGLLDSFERISFEDNYFSDNDLLRGFVRKCDVIVHLAGINRHNDDKLLFDENVSLSRKLVEAMEVEKVTPHVIFSSSIHENLETHYGLSKKAGREIFEDWAIRNNAKFSGLLIPNVFGPFCKPFYNSFVATFCYQLNNGQVPVISNDSNVKLIYVKSLCQFVVELISKEKDIVVSKIEVPYDIEESVSNVLDKLNYFKNTYLDSYIFPELKEQFDINLFNTFLCYKPTSNYLIKLKTNIDNRGSFVELLRSSNAGQYSFSTTVPGITRGNHFHTRKIERFIVVKGNACIKLRKIGTNEVISLLLDGSHPSFVDIPIWYTHNITNIGDEELITLFWINEWYDPEDSDTFFEIV